MPIEPNDSDRDIELVLITGAGASCAFGATKPLAQMRDWSEHLVGKLADFPGWFEATGLTRGMDPEAFERQLGHFLRGVQGFGRIEGLLGPITKMPVQNAPTASAEQWREWHAAANFQLEQIVGAIYDSLYENFGDPDAVDQLQAQSAYASLLNPLGVSYLQRDPLPRWVYATTNYDTIGEVAIGEIGGMLFNAGEDTSSWGPQRPLRVEHLLAGMPRFVPVLHLHGRVGWFQRDQGPVSTQAARYERGAGTPIVMLPDLDKRYDEEHGVINALWRQLKGALLRAKRVLVLGHSLHDKALVGALRENVSPPQRLAVTFLEIRRSQRARPTRIFTIELPGAKMIPILFDAGLARRLEKQPALLEWSNQALGLS